MKTLLFFIKKNSSVSAEKPHCKRNVIFEINQYLGPETVLYLKLQFKDIELRKDMYGNDRMIRCSI
jgi:release factor glutamine methyltransferase